MAHAPPVPPRHDPRRCAWHVTCSTGASCEPSAPSFSSSSLSPLAAALSPAAPPTVPWAPATTQSPPVRQPSSKREQAGQATRRSPSTIGLRPPAAPASAAPRRAPSRTAPRRRIAARRTPTARRARTVVASHSKGSSAPAGARTTSAPPTRIARRAPPACAAPRRPTTARTRAHPAAIASSTPTAAQAGIAPPRKAASERPSIIAIRRRTPASTTQIALPSTRGARVRSHEPACTTRRRNTGPATKRRAALRDDDLPRPAEPRGSYRARETRCGYGGPRSATGPGNSESVIVRARRGHLERRLRPLARHEPARPPLRREHGCDRRAGVSHGRYGQHAAGALRPGPVGRMHRCRWMLVEPGLQRERIGLRRL
jgi:hypothetical protein